MAFRSKFWGQLYASQIIRQHERLVLVRSYAKDAVPPAGLPPLKGDDAKVAVPPGGLPRLKGDEMLKNIFYDVKNKFETAIEVFRKEKITIDPDDPAAVRQYAKVMKTAIEKAGLYSVSQKLKYTIEQRTQGIPDERTYLLTVKEIRVKSGLFDNFDAEDMMMEALDKIEKEIQKPLLRSDKKNMALLEAEFDKINKKLGISEEKYEEELELKVAKADLEELKKDAIEAMETQLKREEFKDEKMVDPKLLDIRNFL